VALWVALTWWQHPRRDVMNHAFLRLSIAENSTIREQKHVLHTGCEQSQKLAALEKMIECCVLI
jgi:hypothetical protein